MELEPLKIKLHKPLHKYNLGYTPNPPTDEELLFYWGVKEKGLRADVVSSNANKKKLFTNFTVDDYIDYAKKHCDPILPDDQEFIPREYWADINDLIGEDLTVLYHPVWGLTRQYINETYIPHSDTLLIQDCSNKKPYIHNSNYNVAKSFHYAGLCDLAVCSIELIPISYTTYYPFRIYDWAHLNETPFMSQALADFNFDRIVSMVQRFKYKRVIFLSKPIDGTGKESDLIQRLRDLYKNTSIEFINVYEKEYFDKTLIRAKTWGCLKAHYGNFSNNRLCEIFNVDPNAKPEPKFGPEDYIKRDNYDFSKLLDMGPNYNPPISMEEIAERVNQGLDFNTGKPYLKKVIKINSYKEIEHKQPNTIFDNVPIETTKENQNFKNKLW